MNIVLWIARSLFLFNFLEIPDAISVEPDVLNLVILFENMLGWRQV